MGKAAKGRKAGRGLAGLVIGLVLLAGAAVAAPPKTLAPESFWLPGIERTV
jgi:hypothetical protein